MALTGRAAFFPMSSSEGLPARTYLRPAILRQAAMSLLALLTYGRILA